MMFIISRSRQFISIAYEKDTATSIHRVEGCLTDFHQDKLCIGFVPDIGVICSEQPVTISTENGSKGFCDVYPNAFLKCIL